MHVLSQAAHGQWDIIYLDPMFPTRRKGALPKIDAQVLGLLQSDSDLDAEQLLSKALQIAGKRVVMKRRLKDPKMLNPNQQLKGNKVRFDIYLT